MEKPLSDVTRSEWIKYQWVDITQMGDEERIMVRNLLRTPEEAYQAMMEWDETAEERGGQEEEKDPTNAEFCTTCCTFYSGKTPPEKPPCEKCGGWLQRQEKGVVR